MSTSMVSTVLEIEREAERILTEADAAAKKLVADAGEDRAAASRAFGDKTKAEVADLERRAAQERDAKVKELTASGDAALSAVRNISPSAFDAGVEHIMKALAGK